MTFKLFRRRGMILAALFLSSIFNFAAASANAAPPANDNLANAMMITGATGTATATTVEATREVGEFTHTNAGTMFVYKTVWFQWTAAQTGPAAVQTSGAGFDASAAVYTGTSFPLNTVAINNDANGPDPRIEFAALAGTTYNIVVGVFNDQNATGGIFTLEWSQNATPSNDNFAAATQLSGTSGLRAVTNQNATSEASEPIFGTGKTIWFSYTNSSPNDYSVTFSSENGFDISADTNFSVFTGSSIASLTPVVKNDNMPTTSKSRVTFLARSGVTYRFAVDAGQANLTGDILLEWNITRPVYYTDFGSRNVATKEVVYDVCADITVFRPSNGVWYSINSINNTVTTFQFGTSGDKPVPADFDGDGLTDYAVTRTVGGLKVWYIRSSFDGTYRIVQWGVAGDREVPGDFDHDGRADLAVFRPSTNVWFVWRSSDSQFFIKEFGLAGDIPVLGDFKGTPAGADLAVFRPSNGTWYIFDGVNTIFAPFGTNGDKPVPADYDFDGRTDLAVFRPSSGTWFYLQSSNNAFQTVQWGLSTDVPMPADFDPLTNDLADFTVFRPSDTTWYIRRSEGTINQFTPFGLSTDIPAATFIP